MLLLPLESALFGTVITVRAGNVVHVSLQAAKDFAIAKKSGIYCVVFNIPCCFFLPLMYCSASINNWKT